MPNLLLSYPGSKATVARWHATLFPPCRWHISVFGGAASEFMYRTAHMEVLNDLDEDLHNMWQVIRDPAQCETVKRLLLATPDGRRQFRECRMGLDHPNSVLRAWAFLIVANIGNIRCSVRTRSWGNSKNRLYRLHEHLDWWHDRMQRVRLECLPWQEVIDRYDRENTLLYCDPPYHPDACNGVEKQYRHVMTAAEHVTFLMRLRQCRSCVMVCGYPHPVYDDLLSDWVQLRTTTRCRIGNCSPRTEVVWLNYQPSTARIGAGHAVSPDDCRRYLPSQRRKV